MLSLLLLLLLGSLPVLAQTPTLEFAAGAGNPMGTGPTFTSQVITFQNNTNNPTGNTLATYTPTTTATFVLSGQQYTGGGGSRGGVMFGGASSSVGSNTPDANALFPLINSLSGSVNTNYTSTSGVTGGIDRAANNGVELFFDANYLPNPVPASARYRYADLTITFNQPMVNPVLHVTGLGTNNGAVGYTAELDLLTTGVSLSRLSGSTELTVNTTQIRNTAANPTTATGTGAASGSVLVTTPAEGITTLQFRMYMRIGNTGGAATGGDSFGEGWLLGVSKLTPTTLMGYVFEDVNYGGGFGRPRTATGAVVRPNATVELYTSAGAFAGTTTTDASGQYTFYAPAGSYIVRVVNSTVTSSRTGYTAALVPVQTYNGTTTRVGGVDPAKADAAANTTSATLASLSTATTIAESQAAITLSGTATTGPDFGYNFDLVVNTNDAGQGSLRQFILNSNALTGEAALAQSGSNVAGPLPASKETSIFMIPRGTTRDGLLASGNGGPASQLTSGVAVISPTSELPYISGANTVVDATTQTFNLGNTNTGTFGAGGTVGTSATTLGTVARPEVQLVGARANYGLAVTGNDVTLRGLALYGFSNNIAVGPDITGTLIEQNIVGTSATSFTDPGAGVRTVNQGIYLLGSDNGIIRNNLIAYNGGMGIWLNGSTFSNNSTTNNQISNNEIRRNALEMLVAGEGYVFDGIEIQGNSTGNTISGNLITENSGHGIDSFGNNGTGGNTISGNTISNNGQGIAASQAAVNSNAGEGSGLRIFSSTGLTTVSGNVITGNAGSGVLVENVANLVTISQNSIYNNTKLAIDLLNGTDLAANGNVTTSNVTLNDSGDGDTGGNGLLNFPIITSATVVGTNLVVQGYARPGAIIEFFNPVTADASGFGEGQTYLGTFTEGSAADTDTGTGTYGPATVNGLSQGTDNTNRFLFTIPISASSFTGYAAGSLLSATATLAGSTSEFAGNVTVNNAPIAQSVNNVALLNTSGPVVLDAGLSGIASGTANGATNTIVSYTILTLPASGTLTYNGTALTAANIATTSITNLALLTYQPAGNTTTTQTFTYTVTDANGITSTTRRTTGGSVGAGAATYSIPLLPVADVGTSITPSANPVNAGAQLVLTVGYSNAGANTAQGLTRSLTLPAGLGAVTVSGTGASYDNATGTVTLAALGSLGPNSSNNVTVTIAAVPASFSSITATSSIGTTTSQAGATANDNASTTITVTPLADVTTTLSGPSALFAVGNNSYTVTFANNGPSPATNVTRTVTLPAGYSALTATGGSVSGNTITYPTLGTLAAGASNSFTFSFTTPAAGGPLSSNIGLSAPGQGTNAAPDQASLNITIAGPPLSCNSVFYRIRQAATGTSSVLERLDRTSTGSGVTYVGTTLYDTGVAMNGLSFNYADGYLYAFGLGNNVLYRLSSTGVQSLGAISGLSTAGYNSATADLNGVLYIANGTSTAITKLTVPTPTVPTVSISTLTLSSTVNFGDIAYNPVDNSLYGNRFYDPATGAANGMNRIDPNTGAVTVLGTPATTGDNMGSLFFDAAGGLYGATNEGNLVNFDTSTGASTRVGSAGLASQSDGASCVFPTQSLDVVLNAAPPVRVNATTFNVTYTATVKNTGVIADPNVQIVNFLNDGSSAVGMAFPGASSVSVVTAPAIASGAALATNPGFNGTSSTGLLAGTTALASNATSTITYTVQVSYPSVAAIPTTAQNNTVYASTEGTSPSTGYLLVNGVALAPAQVLDGEASTNGTTLPATAHGDAPTPTPVTFGNPLAPDLTNVAVLNTLPAAVLNPNLSATPGLNGTGPAISSFTVNAPSSGTLYYGATPVTAATVVPLANLGQLTYQPATGFAGNATFTFSATDAAGGISNPATYTIPVQNVADVTASLTGPTTLLSGQPTGTYTATYTNVGLAAASTVAQTVTLPTGTALSTPQRDAITAAYAGTTFNTTGSGASAVTTITFPPQGTLAAGASNSYRFTFTAPVAAGSSTIAANTSTTSSEGANAAPNTATLALTTGALTDVQALLTASAATATPGATSSFTATFQDNTAQPAAGIVGTVQLPVGLVPSTVSGQPGTPSGSTVTYGTVASLNTTTGLLSYAASSLAANAQAQSIIAFVMPSTSSVAATAGVTTTTAESNSTNNVASASIAPAAYFDLATTLTGPATATAGAPVTLSVSTRNNGPQAVSGAMQTVTIPAGLNAAGAPNVFISNGGTYDNATGVVTFPALGSLPAGQMVGNTITFNAPTSSFAPVARVTPAAAGGDYDATNNTAYLNGAVTSTNLTVNAATSAATNVYVTLTANAQIVAGNTQVTYTAGIGNAGPATASNVSSRLQLLPNLNTTTLLVNNQTGTPTGGGTTITYPNGSVYTIATGALAFANTATLPVSTTPFTATATVTLPAGVGNDGQLLATMSAASQTPDLAPADNVKSVVVTVQPQADLATTLTGPTGGVTAGQTVSYTASFVNNGPGTARVVAETVQLPTGLTAAGLLLNGAPGTGTGTISFANGATYNATTGVLTLPALATNVAGATQSFVLSFPAPAQPFVVSSAVGSATTDGTLTNNAASVATAVTATADVAVSIAGPATAVGGNQIAYAVTAANNGPATATSVVPTLQLPAGLSGVTVSSGSYDSATGLVTFAPTASLAPGTSVVNYATLPMPATPGGGSISPLAQATTTSYDNVAGNNTAGITTSVAPGAGQSADVVAGITGPAGGTATAGAGTAFTFTFQNSATSANPATSVRPVANLPAGLGATSLTVAGQPGTLANGLVSYPNGSTYDPATGTLTFPTTASLAVGASLSYAVAFPAPGSAALLVASEVTAGTTDPVGSNNAATATVTVSPSFDLTTGIVGPAAALAGQQNVYVVTTTASGASPAGPVTQTVTLPLNQTVTSLLVAGQAGTLSAGVITFPNGATYTQSSGLLSFPGIATLTPGAASAVTNSFTLTMPNVASLTLTANVGTLSGETNTGNNSAPITTTRAPLSFAPVAQNIVNTLRSARGGTSNTNLLISPLYATDPDGSIATTNGYRILTLPTSGTLFYNGTTITSIPTGGYTLTNPALLSYQPAAGFVGNAFFTYSATDNSGVSSNTALYTIPVAQDLNTTYTTYNTTKGGTNPYVTNDVLAQLIDPNTAQYSSNLANPATPGIIYNASTGVQQANTSNGLATTGTNVVLVAGALPSGVSFDPATGRIYVSDAASLPRVGTATDFPVTFQTTDLNGGVNQVTVSVRLGAYPLPVELTVFTAQAVQLDGVLAWTTASEKNNDHFDVERSLDGRTFAKIGEVKGQGSKASPTTYSLTDASIGARVSGPVYYRLKQVDVDGTSSYSPVRTIAFTTAVTPVMTVWPNPAAAETNVDLSQVPAGTYTMSILDATGRVLVGLHLEAGLTHKVSLTEVASGTYTVLLRGTTADGTTLHLTKRLIKD